MGKDWPKAGLNLTCLLKTIIYTHFHNLTHFNPLLEACTGSVEWKFNFK